MASKITGKRNIDGREYGRIIKLLREKPVFEVAELTGRTVSTLCRIASALPKAW